MPAKHPVQSITFSPDTINDFVTALTNIGFAVSEKETTIDGITYTHHAKWMSAPFDDGIYFKYYESEYTPLYTYTYTAEQTYSGTTFDEDQIARWRELYPDTFEILKVEDHTSSSFILYRLSKDNRDYENYMLNWQTYKLMGVIIGTQGDVKAATNFRIRQRTGRSFSSGSSNPANDIHKIPYIRTDNGGIIVQSLAYSESDGIARDYNSLAMAFLPPRNSDDHWTSFFTAGTIGSYITYYNGDTIWQAGKVIPPSLKNGDITVLQPVESLECFLAEQPAPGTGHFYTSDTYVNHHFKIDHEIFSVVYGSTINHSMGEIIKDSKGNEFYRFNNYYAILV